MECDNKIRLYVKKKNLLERLVENATNNINIEEDAFINYENNTLNYISHTVIVK